MTAQKTKFEVHVVFSSAAVFLHSQRGAKRSTKSHVALAGRAGSAGVQCFKRQFLYALRGPPDFGSHRGHGRSFDRAGPCPDWDLHVSLVGLAASFHGPRASTGLKSRRGLA